uniref:RGS domain-containing protein n=1 Tax=Neogobius melanostomus TaxID=47308 RepID=A0A8C6WLZ0_9GOBI
SNFSFTDPGGPAHFTEDAPRPPVPGEEGAQYASTRPNLHVHILVVLRHPRRPDLDLGYEPEGSASPTPPYLKWAESLHSLLDDQEGIQLFRNFLCQEGCADLLDFWFACSGFRKTSQEKKVKLAKAIYRKYIIDGSGIVSRQIKPATKSFIRDCVGKPHPDPAMFEQAQTEIQAMMEENTYPLFLKSDLYLEFTQPVIGPAAAVPGYLPTLTENEEWRWVLGGSALGLIAMKKIVPPPSKLAYPCVKPYQPWREPVNPYYANLGYARAPATSANDSEQQSMSSDADTMSLTDSSM